MRRSWRALVFVVVLGCGDVSDARVDGGRPLDGGAPDAVIPNAVDAAARADGGDALDASDGATRTPSTRDRVFARQTFRVGKLALDATHVYWTEADGIARMPLAGGERELVASGQVAPSHLTIEGGELFWINFGRRGTSQNVASSIAKLSLPSGPVQVLADQLLKSNLFRTFVDIQVDATSIILLETGTPQSLYNDGAIQRMAREGGPLTPLVSSLRSAKRLARQGEQLVVGWANVNNDGSLDVYTLAGAGPRALTPAGRVLRDLVVVGEDVWWSVDGAPIRGVPLAGGPVRELPSVGPGTFRCLASDGASLYWATTANGGAIHHMPALGGEPRTLAENFGGECSSLVIAGSAVYWSNDDGLLFKANR